MSNGMKTSLVLLLACGLGGCGDEAGSGGQADPDAEAVVWAPSLDALPDCDEMPALLGGLVDGLIPVDDEENGQSKYRNGPVHGVSCAWLTPKAKSESPFEAINGGSFAVSITVDERPNDEAVLRQMGLVVDDPRVEAIGGYVVSMDKSFDPSEPLGMVGPQVIVGRTTVVINGGGVYLQRVEELAPITNGRAIGASVDLYKALRDRQSR